MSRTFNVTRKPYDKGTALFKKSKITVDPGVTVLVGCNGAGKTTLLRQIKKQLKDAGEPFIEFDNKTEGGRNAMDGYLWNDRIEALATMACSSEGEQIMIVLGDQARNIGILSRGNRDADIYILFDAVDSGFSIDNICELKELLFKTVMEDHPGNVYIICTANSYEMARGEDCVDVIGCRHIRFKDYEEYREFILATKSEKEKRS